MSARDRVLAQWRRVDYAPLEIARTSQARPVSQIMVKVLQKGRFEQRLQDNQIRKVWNQMLDPQIVRHAQPVNLHQGTLFVVVDHSTWLSEIVQYRQKEILDRLRHAFGPGLIKKISFRLG